MAAGFDVEDQRAVADAANFFRRGGRFPRTSTDFAIAAFDEDQFVPGIVGVSQEPDAGGAVMTRPHLRAGGVEPGFGFGLPRSYLTPCGAGLIAESEGLPLTFDEVGFSTRGRRRG